MPSQDEAIGLARKACLNCRKSKRRCDRNLPRCDLCVRKDIECTYPVKATSKRTPQHGTEIDDRLPAPQPLPAESNIVALYFIAPKVLHQARLELPRLHVPIPTDVSAAIGDTASVRSIAIKFFATIHTWMPIISRRLFFTHLLNPLARRQNELSLLAISMLLCTSSPPGRNGDIAGANTDLYQVTKRYVFELEAAGAISIHVLQAAILVAIYEVGHAIYPNAYLTIGTCARYGIMLGIDKLGHDLMGESLGTLSWIEVEERRRMWWAVLLLDRLMNLGNPGRRLATDDPAFDTYLPVDDDAWDECTTKPGDAVSMANGFILKMGRFSRVTQATYLLSQAVKLVSPAAPDHDSIANPDQTAQLRRTLLSLVHLTDTEATIRLLEFCAQSSICFSTILFLQEHYWQLTGNNTRGNASEASSEVVWDETRAAIDRLSGLAISCFTDTDTSSNFSDLVSFFLPCAMYQVTSVLITLNRGRSDGEMMAKIQVLKQLLRAIDKRWRLSGVYLAILEAKEIAAA